MGQTGIDKKKKNCWLPRAANSHRPELALTSWYLLCQEPGGRAGCSGQLCPVAAAHTPRDTSCLAKVFPGRVKCLLPGSCVTPRRCFLLCSPGALLQSKPRAGFVPPCLWPCAQVASGTPQLPAPFPAPFLPCRISPQHGGESAPSCGMGTAMAQLPLQPWAVRLGTGTPEGLCSGQASHLPRG